MSKALITGISGQDGSYLAELLVEKGYEVHGTLRPSTVRHYKNLGAVADKITLHSTLDDLSNLRPDEVYHLSAQSQVGWSFQLPEYTGDVTGLGTTRILEFVRQHCPEARVYQASSSEMFGNAPPPQNEDTPKTPVSPYGAAKVYAYHMTRIYREAHGLFVSNGIMFNHESPRRGDSFVSKKIVLAAARGEPVFLGNIEAKRDWGYAPEYVEAMWKILQLDEPVDLVVGTEETASVRQFAELAYRENNGLNYEDYVKMSAEMLRPIDVNSLAADSSRARELIGWDPKVTFERLVELMMEDELANASRRS